MTLSPQIAAPRLLGLDAVRGLALLGITLVNIAFFSQPMADSFNTTIKPSMSTLDQAARLTVAAFCQQKFFPLYSLLFGMGMAIMLTNARQDGRNFLSTYVRRLVSLAAIGLLHGLLLWYGDILLSYALIGLVLLGFHWMRPRAMITTGVIVLGVGVLLAAGFTAMNSMNGESDSPLPADLAALSPIARFWSGFYLHGGKFATAAWASSEMEAFGHGPYWQAVAVRASLVIFGLIATAVSFGWVVLGMFFLGAGLLKAGFFNHDQQAARRRVVRVGLLVGLPTALAGGVLTCYAEGWLASGAAALLAAASGPLLALMWVALYANLAQDRRLVPVLNVLATVGRMGLTNYLLTSLIASAIMQHWGLAWFGTLADAQQFGLAVAIFALIVVWSLAWSRAFSVGPMESLWRAATYLRRPTLHRDAMPAAAPGAAAAP